MSDNIPKSAVKEAIDKAILKTWYNKQRGYNMVITECPTCLKVFNYEPSSYKFPLHVAKCNGTDPDLANKKKIEDSFKVVVPRGDKEMTVEKLRSHFQTERAKELVDSFLLNANNYSSVYCEKTETTANGRFIKIMGKQYHRSLKDYLKEDYITKSLFSVICARIAEIIGPQPNGKLLTANEIKEKYWLRFGITEYDKSNNLKVFRERKTNHEMNWEKVFAQLNPFRSSSSLFVPVFKGDHVIYELEKIMRLVFNHEGFLVADDPEYVVPRNLNHVMKDKTMCLYISFYNKDLLPLVQAMPEMSSYLPNKFDFKEGGLKPNEACELPADGGYKVLINGKFMDRHLFELASFECQKKLMFNKEEKFYILPKEIA